MLLLSIVLKGALLKRLTYCRNRDNDISDDCDCFESLPYVKEIGVSGVFSIELVCVGAVGVSSTLTVMRIRSRVTDLRSLLDRIRSL